LGNQSEND